MADTEQQTPTPEMRAAKARLLALNIPDATQIKTAKVEFGQVLRSARKLTGYNGDLQGFGDALSKRVEGRICPFSKTTLEAW